MADTRENTTGKTPEEWVRYAETLMLQAEFAPESEKELILLTAKDALLQAEKQLPGSGSWQMACISGRKGQANFCRRYLERAARFGTLPSRKEIQRSGYLASFRNARWFKKFLQSIPES